MNSTDDRETKQAGNWQEQEKQSNSGQRTFTEPDNPPPARDGKEEESVDPEKRPAKQTTGGPDKPTA